MDKDSVRHAVQEHAAEIEQHKDGWRERRHHEVMAAKFREAANRPEGTRGKNRYDRDKGKGLDHDR